MKCRRIQAGISRSLDDGESPPAAIREHLRSCDACRAFSETIEATHRSLRAARVAGNSGVPPALHERTMAAVRHAATSSAERRPDGFRVAWVAALAAASAAILLGWALFQVAGSRQDATGAEFTRPPHGSTPADVRVLVAQAHAIAVHPPAVMSDRMAAEVAYFSKDMARAAEYVLSHLR